MSETIETRVALLEQSLTTISATLLRMETEMARRFDRIEARLDRIEARQQDDYRYLHRRIVGYSISIITLLGAGELALLSLIAKGFHWL